MRKSDIKRFKNQLEKKLSEQLYTDKVIREDFEVNADDRYDEIDQATTDAEQSMRMRLRNRETLLVKKLREALKRIEEGIFGECEGCGEDIEKGRLQARLTATMCVPCKEEEERREILTAAGRKHKSLGESFSRKIS